MAKFPTYEEMAENVAEKALDDFLYDGRSIREWMQIIASEDCISRQAVLDLVADYDLSMGQVVKGIHALPSVTPQPKVGRWIPVSERLPENDGTYLVTAESIGRRITRIRSFAENLNKVDEYDFPINKCGWYDYDCEFGYWEDTEVVAWMPLPDPYKENPTGAEGSGEE